MDELHFHGGQRAGRTAAAIACITAEAENEHEAEMAVKDLYERGVACLKDGKRVVPSAPPPPKVEFDEAPAA